MEQIQNIQTSSFSARSVQLFLENKTKIHSYINKSLVVAIMVVSVSYVATVNDLSIRGFVLQELHNEISRLEAENENRELEVMALESYDKINEKARKLGMVKVDNIDYVSVVDGSVAIR